MANIYALDTERNLLLYHSGNNIFLGTSNGRAFTRAVSLCNDYAGELSDVIYNGTVYFSYQNSNHDIILRNITDTEPVFQILQQDIPDCFSPKLLVFQDTLLLLYFIKNPLNDTYLLKSIFPEHPTHKLPISAIFQNKPTIYSTFSNNRMFLHITAGDHIEFWQIDKDWNAIKLSFFDKNALTDLYAKAQAEYDIRLKEALMEQTKILEKAKQEISQRDAIIESAKRQYNELMDTATKYRDEAIKWRGKFLGN